MSKLNLKTVSVRMTVELAIDVPADLPESSSLDTWAIHGLKEFMGYYDVKPVAVTVIDRPELAAAFSERRRTFWDLRAQQHFIPQQPSDVLPITPQP